VTVAGRLSPPLGKHKRRLLWEHTSRTPRGKKESKTEGVPKKLFPTTSERVLSRRVLQPGEENGT